MKLSEQKQALACAMKAARSSGRLMRQNLNATKKINFESQHDIKLELDVRCQKLIERVLSSSFPEVAILGEEGVAGDQRAARRWVVDPIDGTVNFTYGIPHACVSIALQVENPALTGPHPDSRFETMIGVVYDPFADEIWTAIRGQSARLNGEVIAVSRRRSLDQCMVAIGFAKERKTMDKMIPVLNKMLRRVRKVRIMGAAALALTYVASGRFDAYVESGIRLWDIAAGGLILECAGGEFWHEAIEGEHRYRLLANNGLLRKQIENLSIS